MRTPSPPAGKARPTRFQQRTRRIRQVKRARHLTQLGVAALIVVAAVRHQLDQNSGSASVDALCPFGAVETLITWLSTGSLITKIHPSNLVLGLAVLVATLLVGNAFCGWICPFGAVQDALTWVRRKLNLPGLTVPRGLDRVLRWGRFVVLATILYLSSATVSLWFADYDPYVALFGLRWLFEPDNPTLWIGLSILGVVLVASVLVERAWCRYLCPLGGVLSVLSRFSLLRIRRSPTTCTDCSLCDKECPVGIEPRRAAPMVSPDCIGCMDCVTACPVRGALGVNAPVLLGVPIRVGAGSAPEERRAVSSGKANR